MGKNGVTTFDLYARQAPFGGAFLLVAGLEMAIEYVREFHYTDEDLAFLAQNRDYDPDFLEMLRKLRFSGEILGQMLSIVDQFTRGAADTSVSLARTKARGISEQQWAAAVGADLGRAVGDPRFPAFASILTTPREGPGRTQTVGILVEGLVGPVTLGSNRIEASPAVDDRRREASEPGPPK